MKIVLARIRKIIPDLRDIFIVAGVGFFSYGLQLIYAPLIFLTWGLFFIMLGLPKGVKK